jgi:hypothetical protein
MSRGIVVGLAFFLFCPVAFSADPLSIKDQKWGDLTGRFIFDGEPPKPIELNINKDTEAVKGPVFSESLLVDAKTRGIANVLVRLMPNKDELLQIHPHYEKNRQELVTTRIIGFRFHPHITLVRTGQTLEILSKDSVSHNSKVDFFNNLSYSDVIPANGSLRKVLSKPEPVPCPACCSIHPWESGRLVVQDHPYMTLTSPIGEFALKNLPVGKHSFCFWHETCGFVNKVRRDGKAQEWKKGRLEFEIRPGPNNLGDVLVPAELLMSKQ